MNKKMKKVILLLGCILFIHMHLYAQTKELRIEEDGFEWFLVSNNGKLGAMSNSGNNLIDVSYDSIKYIGPYYKYIGGFDVEINGEHGFYDIYGKCIIPATRKYNRIFKMSFDDLGTVYKFILGNGRIGFCNWEGKEIVTLDESFNRYTGDLWIIPMYDDGFFYYNCYDSVSDLNLIINGDGKIISKCKEMFFYNSDKKEFFYYDENMKEKHLMSVQKISSRYNPFTGNRLDKKVSDCSGFFKGKVEKRKDDTDGKIKYYLEKDGLKSVRDLQGKWIIPFCKEYKEIKIDGSYYFQVTSEKSLFGLYSLHGEKILDMEYSEIENTVGNFLKVKRNTYYGIVTLNGNEIIPTSRGYTFIGDYDSSKGTFAFTKKGFTGVCDAQGREISTTRLAPTADDIKANGGYASVVEMKNGSTKYYKVSKGGCYGLTDSEGKEIVPCEMEALESAGTGYLKYKINGFWGVMNYTGKILIDTDRGYTSIGDFKTFNKRFPYTMAGYKGECDMNGRQVSKIKVETPQQTVTTQTTTTTTPQRQEEQKIIIEHKHDPIPVNVWVQCNICGGSGRCQTCGGSGIYTGPAGNKTLCSFGCGGSGKCSFCAGSGGHYEVEYK